MAEFLRKCCEAAAWWCDSWEKEKECEVDADGIRGLELAGVEKVKGSSAVMMMAFRRGGGRGGDGFRRRRREWLWWEASMMSPQSESSLET